MIILFYNLNNLMKIINKSIFKYFIIIINLIWENFIILINNFNKFKVTALLALSAGAAFASTGALYVTERLRLGPRGGTQLVVRVAVNTPGRKNITGKFLLYFSIYLYMNNFYP